MNDVVQIEIEPGAALMVLPTAGLPTILAADSKDILGALLKELEGWEPDVSTERGRKEIASKAQKVRVAKADFGRLADGLKEDAIKTQKAVNAEFKVLEGRMNELIGRVRQPLDEFEAAEAARIKANTDAIAALEALVEGLGDMTPDEIKARHDSIQPFEWSVEFKARGERVRNGVVAQLQVAHQAAIQREADAAAEALRVAEEAELDRLAEIEARRAREEQIAAEAAERARIAAEERAARDVREAEERSQATLRAAEAEWVRQAEEAAQRERDAAEALARAERERQEAIDRAARLVAEAEATRIGGHKNGIAGIKLMAVGAEALSTRQIDERLERVEVLHQKEWEEFAEEAQAAADTTCETLVALRATAAQREADAVERDRRVAEEAEQQRQQAAITVERQRVARETAAQKAEEARRAANKAHRAAINREAALDLVQNIQLETPLQLEAGRSLPKELAQAVIIAVAKGQIRHMAIDYASVPARAGALL